jgi:signal transduction histidine kinase
MRDIAVRERRSGATRRNELLAFPGPQLHRLRPMVGRLARSLPRGGSLPEAVWMRRQRAIVILLWSHVVAIPLFAVARGFSPLHGMVEGGAVAGFAVPATWPSLGRRLRSIASSLGLLTASAVLVHLSGGTIEMHFHFFVMIGVLTLYEDWLPFLLAIGYVLFHHGVMGTIDPGSVYNHASAIAHPWTWAAIHAGFVAAAGTVYVIAWRLNEDVRAQLKHTNSRLVEAVKELEAFSYSVSHDLRAPLRSIDGFARIALRDHEQELPERARHCLRVVLESAGQMGQLIDDLLAFARLGRQAVKKRPVATASLVHQCLEDLSGERDGRNVEITVGDLPTCEADPALLKHVFTNLLGNALKFTRDRDPARIEVGRQVDEMPPVFYVRDNGAGFDMKYSAKLFGVFQRLHRAEDFEGTGVGLAIVDRIVRRHGGRVWAVGEVGKGATFYLTLEGSDQDH